MATLDLGELEATVSVDPTQFDRGLDEAEDRIYRFRNEVEDIAEEAADAVDRELVVDGDRLQDSLDQQEDRVQSWGERMQTAGAAIGMAIGAALSMALVEAMEVDAAQAELTAALGDEQYAKQMGKIAGHMYTEGWGESIRDNMAAVRTILSTGLLAEDATDQQIEKTAVAAQALAQVFQQDVVAAARAAGQMVRTGMAKDAEEAFDILTRGFQQTGDPAGDLLDTFSEYSTQFRKLGLDGTTAMGLLQQGLKGGARDLDIVADAFKEFSIRSIDGSKGALDSYKALGLNAKEMIAIFAKGGPEAKAGLDLVLDRLRAMKDPTEREAAAVGLFGTQAEDLGAALYALDLDTAAAGMGNVAGASEEMANALGESSSAQLDSFKRKLTEALVEQVAKAIPHLMELGRWANQNKEWLIPLVGVLGGLAAVIAVVVGIVKVWTIAQAALNVVMMMNPIGLIIIAIVALVAGLFILYQKVEWFRNAVDATFGFIIAAAKLWWSVFSGFWTTVGEWLVKLVSGWWSLFTGFWSMIFDGAVSAYRWVTDKIGALVAWVTALPGRLAAAGRGMWEWIGAAFRNAINSVIRIWNNLGFTLPSFSIGGVTVFSGFRLSTPDIPYLAVGGDVTRTGLAVVHAGERVVPAAQAERLRDSGLATGGIKKIILVGTGMLAGLREEIAAQGGDVQLVLGGAP